MRYNQLPKKWVMLLAMAIVLLCYSISVCFGPMTYHTNDDVSIQRQISYFTFDGLWWVPPWISIILSYPLGLLSYYFPQVSWWYVASQFSVAASMLIIHYVVLRLTQLKNCPLWITLALLGIFDFICHIVSIAEIAFTIVPAIICGALISLVFYYPYISVKLRKYIIGLIVVGAVVAVSHRHQSGMMGCAFLLLTVAMILTKMYGFLSKKMLIQTAVSSVMVGIIVVGISQLNTFVNTVAQGEEWMSYSPARSSYMDYSHDSYNDNPDLYHAVGWSEDTYKFANKWIFLSDEITEESFRYIAENSETNHRNISLQKNLKKAINKIGSNTRIKNTLKVMLAVWGLCMVVALVTKQHYAQLFLTAVMASCFVALGYLSLVVGRVIFRSVFIILYPTFLLSILVFVDNYQQAERFALRKEFKDALIIMDFKPLMLKKFFCFFLFIVVIIGVSNSQGLFKSLQTNKTTYKKYETEQLTVQEYVANNPDKMFIEQGFSSISYKNYGTKPTPNSYSMGGSMWRSNFMKHVQEVNGIAEYNWSIFGLPHVYFLGRLTGETVVLLDYLQREHDCLGIAIIESIDGKHDIYCLKFVYDYNKSDFYSYYIAKDEIFVEIIS